MKYEFKPYGKTPRLEKVSCTITEKIDGTNGQIIINIEGGATTLQACSRNRVLVTIRQGPHSDSLFGEPTVVWEREGKGRDNYGFGAWALDHFHDLLKLGAGIHYGEWCGGGIGRGYGGVPRRFVLFNTDRYAKNPNLPACVQLATSLYRGPLSSGALSIARGCLAEGSQHFPGYDRPEGFIVRFGDQVFKVILDK